MKLKHSDLLNPNNKILMAMHLDTLKRANARLKQVYDDNNTSMNHATIAIKGPSFYDAKYERLNTELRYLTLVRNYRLLEPKYQRRALREINKIFAALATA